MKKHLMIATAVVVGLGLSTAAQAATATGTFQVLLTVKKMCNVTAGAASNISLGSVAAGTLNVQGNNTIKVNCSKGTAYTVGLVPNSTSTTTGAGNMSGTGTNTDTVAYQLYSNSTYSTVWGNDTGSGTSNVVTGTGANMGTPQTLNVYAEAPTTDVTPDNYTDTVTVNVNY